MKNLKNKCKRALAAVLSLVMCLGMLTVPAFATEDEVPEDADQTVACTKDDTCTAETHEEGCPKYVAPVIEDKEQDTDTCTKAENCAAGVHEEGCPKYVKPVSEDEEQDPEESDVIASGKIIAVGTWQLTKDGVLTISGKGKLGGYGNKQAAQARGWQEYKDDITEVVIEEGITYVGEFQFYDLPNLKKVSIPSTAEVVMLSSFADCTGLERIEFPEGVKRISQSFSGCTALTEVKLPEEGLTKCPVFSGCTNLKRVNIPSTVTEIPASAFKNCSSLEEIEIPGSVTTIGEYAFAGSGLKSIDIPDSVTTMGTVDNYGKPYGYVFWDCKSLERVKLPKNEEYTDIYLNMFNGCSNLKSIDIPDNITHIGGNAFAGSGLESIVIPATVKSIGGNAFMRCSGLTSVLIEDGATEVLSGGAAFWDCENLVEVILPDTLTVIGDGTFGTDGRKLQLPVLNVPDSVKSFGNRVFYKNDSTVVVGSQSVLSAIGPENDALAKMIYVTGEVTEPVDAIQNCFVAILGGGKVPENPTTTTLAVPDKDGAVFAGWYESADFSGERVASDAAEAGKVYYARWCVDHQWSDWNTTLAPTESTAGSKTHICSICGTEETEDIAPTGHTYTSTVTTEPTCTEQGYTTHTCACGDSYRDTYVDALGHDFAEAWDHDAANHWHVCSRCGKNSDHVSHTETSEITRRPTYTREGERTYTCTVCGATRTESIDRLTYEPSYPSGGGSSGGGSSSGGTTTRPSTNTPSTTIPDNPAPLDPGTTDIVDQNVPLASIVLPFADVKNSAWYRDAVAYVFSKNLMNGVNGDAFAPDLTTQRGMIVTILHRLEGAPAAAAAAFADVQAGQWYADAVGWGSANGVVEGYSASEFAPLRNITREQLAAILYRYAQLKGYDTSKRADLSGYTDAASVSAYALEAMRWAVAEGLITGKTETTLVPGGEATRAEAAMILMRFCETIASAPAANETQGLPDGI